jgi:hypothetical protein
VVNCHGLIIGVDIRQTTGTGKRDGALALVDAHVLPDMRRG